MRRLIRSKLSFVVIACVVIATVTLPFAIASAHPAQSAAQTKSVAKGGLDCNGFSKIQQPVRPHDICTDFQGYDGGRGYDNGHYIGHDEPSVQFFSKTVGSGYNMQWQIRLPHEHDLPATRTFENQIAFWFSMALCDPGSYPQNPCIPDSDANHSATFDPTSAGSAFLEMQFYPPGFSPFITKISCDQRHWCASLHINSLECTEGFETCNPNCIEPTNFAFIQMDGIPTGPAGPASQTNASFTPNSETLLMNPGDNLRVTIMDTANGVLNRIDDLTTGQSGYMVASAANGYQSLDVNTCAPTNFDFHPEFATAKYGNFVPWAALQANIGFASEIGHFTPGLTGDNDADDAPCFAGPTLPGCLNFAEGGDVDFDGSSYLPDWPDGTTKNAESLHITSVLGNGVGPVTSVDGIHYTRGYTSMMFETDVLASESTCNPDGTGCTVPPPGAAFYPFYTQIGRPSGANCAFTFGNDIVGATINDFGRDIQYGTPNLPWFFGTASGGVRPNPCIPRT